MPAKKKAAPKGKGRKKASSKPRARARAPAPRAPQPSIGVSAAPVASVVNTIHGLDGVINGLRMQAQGGGGMGGGFDGGGGGGGSGGGGGGGGGGPGGSWPGTGDNMDRLVRDLRGERDRLRDNLSAQRQQVVNAQLETTNQRMQAALAGAARDQMQRELDATRAMYQQQTNFLSTMAQWQQPAPQTNPHQAPTAMQTEPAPPRTTSVAMQPAGSTATSSVQIVPGPPPPPPIDLTASEATSASTSRRKVKVKHEPVVKAEVKREPLPANVKFETTAPAKGGKRKAGLSTATTQPLSGAGSVARAQPVHGPASATTQPVSRAGSVARAQPVHGPASATTQPLSRAGSTASTSSVPQFVPGVHTGTGSARQRPPAAPSKARATNPSAPFETHPAKVPRTKTRASPNPAQPATRPLVVNHRIRELPPVVPTTWPGVATNRPKRKK